MKQLIFITKYLSYMLFATTAICIILLFLATIIYGDPKTITTDLNNPNIINGNVNYMDEMTYKKYQTAISFIHYTGFISVILAILIYTGNRLLSPFSPSNTIENSNILSHGNEIQVKKQKCPECNSGVKITFVSTDITKAIVCKCLNCDYKIRLCRLKETPPWVSSLGNEIHT